RASLDHQLTVGDPVVADVPPDRARCADLRHQRGIAAEAAAVDADALLVGVAVADGPLGGVDDVVLDSLAPLLVAGVLEALAVAAGAAVVDLQHRVAAAGQQLGFPVERPAVARADRPTVRVDDHRQV